MSEYPPLSEYTRRYSIYIFYLCLFLYLIQLHLLHRVLPTFATPTKPQVILCFIISAASDSSLLTKGQVIDLAKSLPVPEQNEQWAILKKTVGGLNTVPEQNEQWAILKKKVGGLKAAARSKQTCKRLQPFLEEDLASEEDTS